MFPLTVLLFCIAFNGNLTNTMSYATMPMYTNTTPGTKSPSRGWGEVFSVDKNGTVVNFGSGDQNIGNLLSVAGLTFDSTAFIVLISIFVGIAVLASIHILGSGISGSSVPIIFVGGVLVAVWTILSGLGGAVLLSIPAGIGYLMYVVLGIMYTVGVVTALPAGGSD
jgi:hypothetical protein